MTKRSVASVIILTIVTLGIYGLVWVIKTKNEMMQWGAPQMPSGWMLLCGAIPIVGAFIVLWWYWKFAGGVEHVTGGKLSQVLTFILFAFLSVIGIAIIQAELNKAIDRGMPGQLPQARVA